jgi:hypothetical protein
VIIKGNQRGGGQALARHLMNARDNDHVELHELSGFASGDLPGAFMEVEAAAEATRCRQPFFSVSLNPPKDHNPGVDDFENAADLIEAKFPGLKGQARTMIFHEKEGRRHAHAVWSRITERGVAVQLSHSREKLRDVSCAMYAAMGIEPPAGIRDRQQRDPLNYDIDTWQQAKRMGEDPRDLKAIIQEAWAASDDRASFERALEQSALALARGDKRGFVVVDHSGEVLSLTRYTGLKSKDLKARLGEPEKLPTVDQVRSMVRDKVLLAVPPKPGNDMRRRHAEELRPLSDEHRRMKEKHGRERHEVERKQAGRWKQESQARAGRLRTGIMGLWDRLSGKRGKVSETNAREIKANKARDRAERHAVVEAQMQERGELQGRIVQLRDRHRRDRQEDRTRTAFALSMLKDGPRADFMAAMQRIEERKRNPPTAAQMRRERAERTNTMPVIVSSDRKGREAENSPVEAGYLSGEFPPPANEQAPAAPPEQAHDAKKPETEEERQAGIDAERAAQEQRDRGHDDDPGREID